MFVSLRDYQRAKHQYLILLNNIVPKNREQFLGFKRFSDCLDSFYARFLEEREELEALQKVLKVIFCLFHRLSAVERAFNTDDFFTVENQSTLSLKTLRMVQHDHMCP